MLRTLRRLSALVVFLGVSRGAWGEPLEISGIHPSLALFNDTDNERSGECGIGAVAPWADRLWLLTYPPHARTGSSDKLYEIDPSLEMTIRPESVGGTHAGRMIHRESRQLILGPYFIDEHRHVRAVDQKKGFPARITAIARHLTDPENKVYMFDMEGPIWEVDVHTLEPRRLFVKPVPGWHGKGAYTGQGHLVIANNGEARAGNLDQLPWELPEQSWSHGPEDAGVLAEWSGPGSEWKVISRRAHTDVTGPGGLTGESAPDAPIWSIGWDRRSVLLDVRSGNRWLTYRLPKGSYTYDPSHGWFTEWPRIRQIGADRYLLNMHGTFYDFPPGFAPGKTGGLRPLATHLHYTTDFCEWNGRIVFSGDDTSVMDNPLAGKPQSNLRMIPPGQLESSFGPREGWGGVWVRDRVEAGQISDPFLVSGYSAATLHLANDAKTAAAFALQLDRVGDGHWSDWQTVKVPSSGYIAVVFSNAIPGQWLRLESHQACEATAFLHLSAPSPGPDTSMFRALAPAGALSCVGGLVRPANFSRDLQFLARTAAPDGKLVRTAYYEVDEHLGFRVVKDAKKISALTKLAEIETDVAEDSASLILTDDQGKRWRIPKAPGESAGPPVRGLREVVSERFLANYEGTFYEVPRRGTRAIPDFARMKPVASHSFRITDFCSWRGLLVLAGTRPDAQPDGHFFRAAESGDGLWFGAIDDLYKLGAPVGVGGPWKDSRVRADEPSDPYLMTNYGRKSVALSHESEEAVRFELEVDFLADGTWHRFKEIGVPPKQTVRFDFPEGFGAHWARVRCDRDTRATAWFRYDP